LFAGFEEFEELMQKKDNNMELNKNNVFKKAFVPPDGYDLIELGMNKKL